MAGRSDFGVERKHPSVVCQQCRMKFDDEELLAKHQRNFCDKGNRGIRIGKPKPSPDAPATETSDLEQVTANDIFDYTTGKAGFIGHISVGQLRQTMNAGSLSELQLRNLDRQREGLAAQIREYKASFEPPTADPSRPAGAAQKGEQRTQRQRPKSSENQASIASMIAREVMGRELSPPRRRTNHSSASPEAHVSSRRPPGLEPDTPGLEPGTPGGGGSLGDGSVLTLRGAESPYATSAARAAAAGATVSPGTQVRRGTRGGVGSPDVEAEASVLDQSGFATHRGRGSVSPIARRPSHEAAPQGGTGGEFRKYSPSRAPSGQAGPPVGKALLLSPPTLTPTKPGAGERGAVGKAVLLSPPTVSEGSWEGQGGGSSQVAAEGWGGMNPSEAFGGQLSGVPEESGSAAGRSAHHTLEDGGGGHQQSPEGQPSGGWGAHHPWPYGEWDGVSPPQLAGGQPPAPTQSPYPAQPPYPSQTPYPPPPPHYPGSQQYPPSSYPNQPYYPPPYAYPLPGRYPPPPNAQPPYLQQQPASQIPSFQLDPSLLHPHHPHQQQSSAPVMPVPEATAPPPSTHYMPPPHTSHDRPSPTPLHPRAQNQYNDTTGGFSPLQQSRAGHHDDVDATTQGRRTALGQGNGSVRSGASSVIGGDLGGGAAGGGVDGEYEGFLQTSENWGGRDASGVVRPPKAVKDPVGKLRPVGIGRQPKEEIRSADWYESVARTEIEKPQAVELKREVGAVGAIVGMSVEHGYDMVALQQEVERLRLERDRVKVNNDLENARMAFKRDEWLVGKRVGVKEAKDLRSLVPEGSLYDPVYGFEVRIDAVTPTPPGKGDAIVLVYGLFEGTTKSGPLKTTQRSIPEFSFKTRMKRARFEVAHDFVKLAPARNVSLVIEVQVAVGEFSTQAAGWTVIPIFTEEGDVMQGDWSVPVFAPPLSIGVPWDQLDDLPLAPGEPHVLIRLARNKPKEDEYDEFGATPEPEEFAEEEKPAPEDDQYILPPHMSLPTPKWVRREYELGPPESPKTPLAGVEGLDSLKMEKEGGRDSKLSGLEGIQERAWVDYVAPSSALKPCAAPDILVVVLDSARFLPDNVSVTRATLSLVNEQGINLTEEATTTDVGDVDSGVHSPRFALALVLLIQDLSPRTWISVRIDAVDPMSDNKSVTVGFATIPLMLHPATGRTPTHDQANAYNKDLKAHLDSLDPPEGQQQEEIRRAGVRPPPRLRVQIGGVQIPIRVAPGAYVSRDPSTLGKQPRMPCCTALLRVFLNPTEEDVSAAVEKAGLRAVLDDYLEEEEAAQERERISKMAPQAKRKGQVRDGLGRERDAGDKEAEEEEQRIIRIVRKLASNKPPYPTGQYDSSACHPSGSEGATYSVRLAQFKKDITIRDSLAQLLDEETYERVRGSTAAARNAARGVISQGDAGRLPPSDLTFFCAYNPGVGLKLVMTCAYGSAVCPEAAVDGANNLPLPGRSKKGAIPICFMGVSSQCNFFTLERMTLDAHANCAIAIESSVKHPRWAEGYRFIQNVPFRGETGGLIIQVAWLLGHTKEGGWQEKDAKIESVGWTAVSLFTSETQPYVTCGSFVVPLYKGEVPVDVSDKLDLMGVEKTLKKMEDEGKAKLLGEANVLVRLVDLQRGATANPTMPPLADDANLNLPREWSEKMVATWPSGKVRMPEPKVAKYWQVQKGLLEGRTKTFKETHLGKTEKEAAFQESMRNILTSTTGIQAVEIQTHAAGGPGA